MQGCFVGNISGVGSDSVLISQLKWLETGDFAWFCVKIGGFSCFSLKNAVAERVSRPKTMTVGAGGK